MASAMAVSCSFALWAAALKIPFFATGSGWLPAWRANGKLGRPIFLSRLV